MHRGGSTVRTILNASWKSDQEAGYRFDIVANAFLYHMVRRLVKIQVSIGQQVRPISLLRQALTEPAGETLQGLAPPNGLVLEAVRFTELSDQQA